MAYRTGAHNFSKGVLTAELWGRSDIVPYNAAVRQGDNVLVLKYGGLTKRPGTRYIYEIKDGTAKLFPFEGAYNASYVMLMSQAAMRLGALGGMVVEKALTVQAVTLGNPTVITANYHGFSTGDEVYFTGVEGAVWLNGRILTVTKISTNTFSVPIDSTALAALTGDTGGTINSSAPPPPPPPPPVPPPPPPPTPPSTGGDTGGSGSGGGSQGCPRDTMLILLANARRDGPGGEVAAGRLKPGDWVWTMHEKTLGWGAYPVVAADRFVSRIYALPTFPEASPSHPFGLPRWIARLLPRPWRWWKMGWFGRYVGDGWAVKITVRDAHTFMARLPGSKWRWSHNKQSSDI